MKGIAKRRIDELVAAVVEDFYKLFVVESYARGSEFIFEKLPGMTGSMAKAHAYSVVAQERLSEEPSYSEELHYAYTEAHNKMEALLKEKGIIGN